MKQLNEFKSFHKTDNYLYQFKYYNNLHLTVFIDKPNSWGLYAIGLQLHFSLKNAAVYFRLTGVPDRNLYPANRELIDLVINTRDVDRIIKVANSLIPTKSKVVKKSIKPIQLSLFEGA